MRHASRHKRTSLDAPPQVVERLVAVAASEARCLRPPPVELRSLVAKVGMIKRPVRAGVVTSKHMAMGWLGERVTEFRWLLRTFGGRASWSWLLTMVEEHKVELVREMSRISAP